MSLYGAEFLKQAPELLFVQGCDPPDMQFVQGGYLFLASPSGETILHSNHEIQKKLGADVELLDPKALELKFPWLNAQGLVAGSLGRSNEGWFDPWSLMSALKRKSIDLGVKFIQGNVTKLNLKAETIDSVEYLQDSVPECRKKECISTGVVINAAGPWAGRVAATCEASNNVPVEPRKRSVFVFHCPDERLYIGSSASPLVVDPSGVYFRREGTGGHFITGVSPEIDHESMDDEELDYPDYELFDQVIWPTIATRVKAFENIKLINAWSGYYEYNTLDQNAIIGPHDAVKNLFLVNGFSGHGLQQAPAAGRAISELLIDGKFTSIDLSCLSFDRVIQNEPLFEHNIV